LERRMQLFYRSKPAPPGSLCQFGVTADDERSHCVMDQGKFGSFGWCYTKADRSEWGSCAESCPLEGSTEVLARRIDILTEKVQTALARLNATQCLSAGVK